MSEPETWIQRARSQHFGRHVWRGTSSCPRCGHELSDILFDERSDVVLEPSDPFPALWYSCPRCGDRNTEAGHRFTGLSAEHIFRRMLAYENFSGADETVVRDAMSWIEAHDSAEGALQHAAEERLAIGQFSGTHVLAIEIALTAHVEQSLKDLELKHLEARWREEEEIAAIVDRELTPP